MKNSEKSFHQESVYIKFISLIITYVNLILIYIILIITLIKNFFYVVVFVK